MHRRATILARLPARHRDENRRADLLPLVAKTDRPVVGIH